MPLIKFFASLFLGFVKFENNTLTKLKLVRYKHVFARAFEQMLTLLVVYVFLGHMLLLLTHTDVGFDLTAPLIVESDYIINKIAWAASILHEF